MSSPFSRLLLAFGLFGSLLLITHPLLAQKKEEAPKLDYRIDKGMLSPVFSTIDINGEPVSLQQYKGKRVLLAFMRHSGCPICNLRFHELLSKADSLEAKNMHIILVYESEVSQLQEYLGNRPVPFTIISDPTQKLYDLFRVEKSRWGLARGLIFEGGNEKTKQGKSLFDKEPEVDFSRITLTRMTADFIISPSGYIDRAFYGRFYGDYMPL